MKRLIFLLLTLLITVPAAAADVVTDITTPVTISEKGTYRLSGIINGTVIVDAGKSAKVELLLDNVTIDSADSPAVWVKSAEKVTLTLVEGTDNSLTNGGKFSGDEDAALYAKDDLVIDGGGTLIVNSPAGDGINCRDELVIKDGTLTVSAASNGIVGKEGLTVGGGIISVNAGNDALRVKDAGAVLAIKAGLLSLTAGGDGISAGGNLNIENGFFVIVTGGGSAEAEMKQLHNHRAENKAASADENALPSAKGLKADGILTIDDGTFRIDSRDDALHSNADVIINGGSFDIRSGDDAVHADRTVTVNGGQIDVYLSYEGIEGRDVVVNGGEIRLECTDDGMNAAETSASEVDAKAPLNPNVTPEIDRTLPSVTINGGNIYIHSKTDAIDANGNIFINGGSTVLCGPASGDTQSLDFDGVGIISGGTFIGTGASTWMSQTFSGASQGVITQETRGNADVPLRLTDTEGNLILETVPAEEYSLVILSAPELVSGGTYLLNDETVTAK